MFSGCIERANIPVFTVLNGYTDQIKPLFLAFFFLDSLITKDREMQYNQEIVLRFSWVKKRVEGHVLFRSKVFSVGDFLKIDWYWRITQRYTNAGLKISLYVCVHIKTIPSKFRIPGQDLPSYLCLRFVNFLKFRLIFNIFYCSWMFVNKHLTYLTCAYLKK